MVCRGLSFSLEQNRFETFGRSSSSAFPLSLTFHIAKHGLRASNTCALDVRLPIHAPPPGGKLGWNIRTLAAEGSCLGDVSEVDSFAVFGHADEAPCSRPFPKEDTWYWRQAYCTLT